MDTNKKAIGDRIRTIRKAAGINQETLGAKLGVSVSQVSAYENGDSSPSPESLATIALIGNKSLDWLITGVNMSDPYERHGIDRAKEKHDDYGNKQPDLDLMKEAIILVSEVELEIEQNLSPDKRAEIVGMIITKYSAGQKVEVAEVMQLVRLAA